MAEFNTNGSPGNSASSTPPDLGFSPWQRLKSKNISYLTIPLLVMATVVEFVILTIGWKYQQTVCLPQGMGVTFLGIGPIGAAMLAVELLKLPLAIWTASRQGWAKGFMLVVGLPMICLLTFQLVKDMAVYEMGTAMAPASQMLEKAAIEEIKINQLNGELAAIEGKRTDREHKLGEVTAKQTKAKAELEELMKRNEAARQDAISLTDYQKKELSEVETRQATIIQQFASDTEQLTKAIADLRVRREAEFARSSKDSVDWEKRKAAYDAAFAKWHTEDARIDNVFATAKSDYANRKATYEKDKAEYVAASFLKRQLMREPVDPGVPPVREVNKFPKPADLDGRPSALIAEIDAQLKAKEAELLVVNNKRRDRIAQVDADARRLREEFDHRSTTKREETDRKREELSTALAALAKEEKTERDQIDKEFETVVQKVDSIRAEVDASRKKAEAYYEAREAAIRKTQVHRIATTVEIVRGLIMGERPMSIKATAKERGDILTDQISMVRIWVYPVLAFIVAFLPTLMVEIGFTTVFQPEQQRRQYRMGFLGRRLHWLYTRAGRLKILRAERIAREATAQIATRDQAVLEARGIAEKAEYEKQIEVQAAHDTLAAAGAELEQTLKRKEQEYTEQAKRNETEWVTKLASMADSLNRAIVEKDSMRELQKAEVERQVQMRQGAWSDRLAKLRQDLDDQRSAQEAERTALMQEHHRKLLEVTEDCRSQVVEARRQIEASELAAVENSAKLAHDLKDALDAREAAESQLKHQADTFAIQLSAAQEDAGRGLEKTTRQEKLRSERQQLEFEKTLRYRLQQQEAAFQAKFKQREEELAIKASARETELQNQAAADLRAREEAWERQAEARASAVESRLRHEADQNGELLLSKSRQRDQQWQAKLDAFRAESQTQTADALRRRDAEADTALRQLETQLRKEMQEKEEAAQSRVKQREQELAGQLAAQAEARVNAARALWEAESEKRVRLAIAPFTAQVDRAEKERDEARQAAAERARQVDHLEKKLTEASSFLNGWRSGNGTKPTASQPGRSDWALD